LSKAFLGELKMPRPRRKRWIRFTPGVTYFKPAGVRTVDLKEVVLTLEESEAIRLIDFEKVEQSKAGKKMNISQPTLSRLLKSARKKISDAIINGKAIKIQGGTYKMVQPRGRGRMKGKFLAGPGGNCVCPKCKYEEPQQRGAPCRTKKCPKCQTLMTRKFK
jgi:predicted DNA-binding protein (UPF0251 family)